MKKGSNVGDRRLNMGKNNSKKKEKTEFQKWHGAFAKVDYQAKKEQEAIKARMNDTNNMKKDSKDSGKN